VQAEEREQKIASWSQKILAELKQVLPSKPLEADFRQVIDPLLQEFCKEVDLHPITHAEFVLATGRADAVFNRLVIEYKAPGKLKKTPDAVTLSAIQQVKDYIEDLAKEEHREIERMAGVVFDGNFLIFVRSVGGKLENELPVEVNLESLQRFLTWLSGLSSGIALTSENLNRDFALEQLRTQNILRRLFQALDSALAKEDGLVSKLFEQWRLFFSEAIDYSEAFGGRKLEPLKKWVRKAGLEVKDSEEAERFFFVLHTYFALLVKLLAWMAIARHLGVKIGGPSFFNLATTDSETLRRSLEKMESGGIFRDYGILNLLEGDFFAWYLYAWNEKMEEAIREIIKRLDDYDPTTLTIVPEETRDLFKKLYHYLLPREIRHNLGEYYTPDWLAQRLLVQVDNEFFLSDPLRNQGQLRRKVLTTRFLDPACGSGTFLILIIARMREISQVLSVQESELLEAILKNVVGFDLNPLAVLIARVNYLLAIADLLKYQQREITIPIYLADSVRTPAKSMELLSHSTFEFPTAVGNFQVSAALCTKERFDNFCNLLEDSLKGALDVEAFIQRIERELNLSPPEWDERAVALSHDLYKKLLDLHRRGLNGLWARLLKNNFAPLTVGQFDYIVGNPPWVNWENLPDRYRKSIAPIWLSYELFQQRGMRAAFTKDDISILMTYVVSDRLLKDGGKLGFVITQSVFKSELGGRGFRRFRISQNNEQEIPLRVLHVDDMVTLQPFEGASNRTAVLILEKGKPTKYPVSYTVWRKEKGASFSYDNTLKEVTNSTKRMNFVAEPVNLGDLTSSWLTARPKALKAIRKVLGRSDYEAHEGVNTGGANGVYWVKVVMKRPDGLLVVRNLTEDGRIRVEEVTEPIEPDLLYPLLRGRDVGRWKAEPSALILLTHLPGERLNAIPEKEMQTRFPYTYSYLKRFEKVLLQRGGWEVKQMIKAGKPFYSMSEIGDYTFAPWKVVWREQASGMTASIIGTFDDKPVIPDHKLMLVDCKSQGEAHFVCALLNSTLGGIVVTSYAIEIQMGPHILENIRIPRYNPNNALHRGLAELSERAHEAARLDKQKELRKIEAEIDNLAAQLWELTPEELREIQKSLKELGSIEGLEEEA